MRHLYAVGQPIMQVELAEVGGVSQPAVSQYMASLRASGDVSSADPGWLGNRTQLPSTYWASYASRFAEQSIWYRIDAPAAQVADVVERAPHVIVSGDIGADAVAPWRVPTVAIIYGDVAEATLDDLGFVHADTPAAASLLIRPVPDDRFATQVTELDQFLVAPLLHLAADMVGLGGDDRAEAVERIGRVAS